MATRRSRNKMERKAHMSIHDTLDVVEGEIHATDSPTSFTKDRFGKKHLVKKVSDD